MAFALLKSLLCCCYKHKDEDDLLDEHNAETSRLIPDDLESEPTMYSNRALAEYQRIQERLGTIVRASEGKMVNIGSQIPFNLHNQVLPRERNHTISRSNSGSFDYYNQSGGDYGRPTQHQQPYPRFSTSHSPGRYGDVATQSRSGSREREAKPKPILNIRLVGFVDRRGRSRQRKPDTSLDVGSENTVTVSHMPSTRPGNTSSDPETLLNHATSLSDKLKRKELGAISMSWGD